MVDIDYLLSKQSFIELDARERAKSLFDQGSFKELLDPFSRMPSSA